MSTGKDGVAERVTTKEIPIRTHARPNFILLPQTKGVIVDSPSIFIQDKSQYNPGSDWCCNRRTLCPVATAQVGTY